MRKTYFKMPIANYGIKGMSWEISRTGSIFHNMVKNLCLDFLRSPKASRRDNEEALETVLLTTDSSPEKELEEKEDIRHIQELIEQLPRTRGR